LRKHISARPGGLTVPYLQVAEECIGVNTTNDVVLAGPPARLKATPASALGRW
jgi:hypothetical protein